VTQDDMRLRSVPLDAATVQGADCVIVVTDHSNTDFAMIGREAKALVDTRHVVPRAPAGR